MIMAIIKTKSIYNVKNIHLIHHGYRTVASILELTVLINFAFSLTIRTQKKMLIKWFIINAYYYI